MTHERLTGRPGGRQLLAVRGDRCATRATLERSQVDKLVTLGRRLARTTLLSLSLSLSLLLSLLPLLPLLPLLLLLLLLLEEIRAIWVTRSDRK